MASLGIKGLIMTVHGQRNYDILSRVIFGELRVDEAARLLGKSYRHTLRMLKRVREKGMMGLKHGNSGRCPVNKTPEDLKKNVLNLLSERYFDFNLTHFREKLQSEHGIVLNAGVLRTWAHEKNLVKRAHRRKRARVNCSRPRMPKAGMLLQMDGSHHRWMGPNAPQSCLIGAIDDATSICPYAEFFPGEDTLSVLAVLKRIVERVGVPEVLYVDRAAHFKTSGTSTHMDWNQHLSHVERAMGELGCRVLFAYSAQAKGRVERMWATFQDRLVPEMRLRNIRRIPSANYFLQNIFVPEFNARWSKLPADPTSAYKPTPTQLSLDSIFCMREWRKVTRGETISLNGSLYCVNHEYDYSLRGMHIEIRSQLDGSWGAYHANRPIKLVEMPK